MSRARRATLALLSGLVLSVGVAACGGEQVPADEVAAPPPELTIPSGGSGADALAGGASTTSTTDTSTTSTTDTTASGDTAAGSGSTAGATGGTAAPAPAATPAATAAPQQDSAQNDAPPPAGSGAQKFEEFCQQNAGAC
jgi:hypothetical protein